MKIQYIITEEEIKRVKDRFTELKHVALLSRDADQMADNREYYLRAKGFEEALRLLGIIK